MRFRKSALLVAALLASIVSVGPGLQAQISGSGVSSVPGVRKLAASAIPFIIAPTGTMANNGAITLGTALPTTYANAYVFLPASAISAGSATGWYFAQFSSATLGTVFNNTYVSGTPSIPAPTAFVTTGPGAYTGVITLQNAVAINIPGNSMGPNGTIRYALTMTVPNNANNKQVNAAYSTLAVSTTLVTTNPAASVMRSFSNRGATNSQVTDGGPGMLGPALSGGVPQFATIDSTQTQVFAFQAQLAVATDYIVIERFLIEVIPG